MEKCSQQNRTKGSFPLLAQEMDDNLIKTLACAFKNRSSVRLKTYWKDPSVFDMLGYSYRENLLISSVALSETLKTKASSRNRRFSVGMKPSWIKHIVRFGPRRWSRGQHPSLLIRRYKFESWWQLKSSVRIYKNKRKRGPSEKRIWVEMKIAATEIAQTATG